MPTNSIDLVQSEPPPGSIVADDIGGWWLHSYEGGWFALDNNGEPHGDPESWNKVNGNYGPATLIEAAADD